MGWQRPHLYLCEPLAYQEERQREQKDPHPGVSSLDEARTERMDDFDSSRVRPLPPAEPAGIRRLLGRPGNADAGVGDHCPRRPPGPDDPHAA